MLEPGDLLYLPPGVAHEGVALGECITLSIGFRAPAWQELVEPWFLQLAERTRLAGRYADAGAPPTALPGRLPSAMVEQTWRRFARLRPRRSDAVELLLAQLTEPKAQVIFDRPRRPLQPAAFSAAAARGAIELWADARTRCLYSAQRFAINGEILSPAQFDRRLARLADDRQLAAASLRSAPLSLLARLHEWYVAGWLHVRAGADDH